MAKELPPSSGSMTAKFIETAPQDLPPETGWMASKGSLVVLTPWSLQLIAHAKMVTAEGQGHNSFGVMLAHAAVEWATADALSQLLRRGHVPEGVIAATLDAFTTSFEHSAIRKMYERLTGESLKNAAWWKPWYKSRSVRHDVAHRGRMATADEARNAISTCESYVRHVAAAIERSAKAP